MQDFTFSTTRTIINRIDAAQQLAEFCRGEGASRVLLVTDATVEAAVHALAYPLGGHFHIPHGLSNSLVLPQVLRFNASVAAAAYAELAPCIMGSAFETGPNDRVTERLICWLENLIQELGLPTRLRDCGVNEGALERLARDAMQQRLLVNNPRPLTEQDALAIYRAVY